MDDIQTHSSNIPRSHPHKKEDRCYHTQDKYLVPYAISTKIYGLQ